MLLIGLLHALFKTKGWFSIQRSVAYLACFKSTVFFALLEGVSALAMPKNFKSRCAFRGPK